MSCWDTSALLKLYLSEIDSVSFVELASAVEHVTTSAIARYEAEAAFRRKEADGALVTGDAELFQQQFDADIQSGAVKSVALNPDVEREFSAVLTKCLSQSPPVFVRTNDALHIATALAEGETYFVTADVRQGLAAALMGMTVLP